MKSVINHEETFKLLAKSISQVADRLPQVEVVSELYPTGRMEVAVEKLYSCLIEFLMMAYGWINESKLSHIIHSITRPPELEYTDLLERITTCSREIRRLAVVASQAELRIMHASIGKIMSGMESSESTLKDVVMKLDSELFTAIG